MFEEKYKEEIMRFAALEDVSFQSALDVLEREFKTLNYNDVEFKMLLIEWELK